MRQSHALERLTRGPAHLLSSPPSPTLCNLTIIPQYQPTRHLEPHVPHISHSRIPIIQVSADFRYRLESVREGDQEKSSFRTPLRRITRLPLCRCYSVGASMPVQGVKTISNRRRRVTPVVECDRECPPSILRHIWRGVFTGKSDIHRHRYRPQSEHLLFPHAVFILLSSPAFRLPRM